MKYKLEINLNDKLKINLLKHIFTFPQLNYILEND
jgi:hypothetical protein